MGAEPGYGSPIGVDRSQVLLVVDDLVARARTWWPAPTDRLSPEEHERWPRLHGRPGAGLRRASDGHACSNCGEPLVTVRGVEVGNIFKLGTKYSESMGAFYLDENGEKKPIVMGSYGIGSGRLMAVLVDLPRRKGIQWPITVAPYHVALISLATERTPEVTAAAEQIYADLLAAGVEVLYDDRDERAGVKFNDADLLGPDSRHAGRQGAEERGGRDEAPPQR